MKQLHGCDVFEKWVWPRNSQKIFFEYKVDEENHNKKDQKIMKTISKTPAKNMSNSWYFNQ